MNLALALPAMPRVPEQFTFGTHEHEHHPKLLKLAEILLELGVVRETDAPKRGALNERALLERALTRWATEALGHDLTAMKPVGIGLNPDTAEEIVGAYENTGNDAPQVSVARAVTFALVCTGYCDVWLLQKRAPQIESRTPGLAETALHLVTIGTYRSANAITPAWAAEIAEHFYGWEGEMEEEDQPITRKDFQARIPRWVSAPRRKLSRRVLQALAAHDELADACLALLDAVDDREALVPDVGGYWHTGFSCALRWSMTDPIGQIADNYCNDAMQSDDGTDDFSWHLVELDVAEVSRFLDRFRRLLRALACTDRVISLIAERAR